MALENPPVFEHGFVTGRYVTAVADTRDDPDRYPDLLPIVGQMNFMPLQEVHLKGGEHPATVVKQEISIGINSQGYVADEQSMDLPAQIELTEEEFEELSEEERIAFEEHNLLNRPGVYLAVGLYRVRPVFRGVRNIPEFEIRVTAEHTKESPLDLTLHAPLTPPPGFTEVVRVADRILAEEAAEAAQRFRDETEAFAQTDQFLLYIQEAESARDTARGHAEAADAHRISAGEHVGQASVHVDEAREARDTAFEARDGVAGAMEEAKGYSESASESADSASTSSDEARNQADRSESEAEKSAESASEAGVSQQAAAQEATNASQSATDAQESATTASGHAEAAEVARGAAEGHSADAETHATTAGEHAQSVGGVVEEAKGHADRAESASDSAETHREGAETAYSQAQDLIENLSPTDFPVATPESRGFMSSADKRKLDGSTSEADPNSIVERGHDGVFSVADPTDDSHVTNKGYVDASIQEHTPDLPDNLATEEYVDSAISGIPPFELPSDLATESYVDDATSEVVRNLHPAGDPSNIPDSINIEGAVRVIEDDRSISGTHVFHVSDEYATGTSWTVRGSFTDSSPLSLHYASMWIMRLSEEATGSVGLRLQISDEPDEAVNTSAGWFQHFGVSTEDNRVGSTLGQEALPVGEWVHVWGTYLAAPGRPGIRVYPHFSSASEHKDHLIDKVEHYDLSGPLEPARRALELYNSIPVESGGGPGSSYAEAIPLASSDNLQDLEPGIYKVNSPTIAGNLNMPVRTAGLVEILPTTTTRRIARYTPLYGGGVSNGSWPYEQWVLGMDTHRVYYSGWEKVVSLGERILARQAVVTNGDKDRLLTIWPDRTDSPASALKVLTAHVARTVVSDSMLDQTVTFTSDDSTGGSSARLEVGDVVSWRDLFHGMMLPSGNDAASCIARNAGGLISGSGDPYDKFIAEMNRLAESYGWEGARFTNPSGLGRSNNEMSAEHLTDLMFRVAESDSWLVEVMGTYRHEMNITGPNARSYYVVHSFDPLGQVAFPEAIATKTGTLGSHTCLIMLFRGPNGENCVGSIIGSTSENRYPDMRRLIDRAVQTMDPEAPLGGRLVPEVNLNHRIDERTGGNVYISRSPGGTVTLTFAAARFSGDGFRQVGLIPDGLLPINSYIYGFVADGTQGNPEIRNVQITRSNAAVQIYGGTGGQIRGTLNWTVD